MANASIGGLVSGLDTATIISQLMQLEARPRTMLKSRVSSEERAVTALQTLNAKLAAIGTKAADLADPANWSPMKATSSNDKVSVIAAATAQLTSLSFNVKSTATASAVTMATAAEKDAAGTFVADTTVTVNFDDASKSATTFDTGSGSLTDVMAAINAVDEDGVSTTGLQASLVRAGGTNDEPTFRLHVVSRSTGAASGFAMSPALGAVAGGSNVTYSMSSGDIALAPLPAATYTIDFVGDTPGTGASFSHAAGASLETLRDTINSTAGAEVTASLVDVGGGEQRLQLTSDDGRTFEMVRTAGTGEFLGGVYSTTAGSDAQIVVNGQTVSSGTNIITDVMPDVDITLAAGATGAATIQIARDTGSLSGKVKAMVDAVNFALDELSSLTKTGADAKDRGLLAGDSTLRNVRNQLVASVTGGVGGQSLATYGIETDRYGKLTFDEAKFKAAYEADPDAAAAMFADPTPPVGTTPPPVGFAAKIESLSDLFSDSIDGTITNSIKSRQSQIKGWEDDIADWDTRLLTKENALRRQYTALETALGQLQSQGNWLAGQLASLPKMSSGQ
jgi:flagellar hook-associated protein 2